MTKIKFSIVIYLLSSILVIILSIFVYRLITHIPYLAKPDEVTISKYMGERIQDATPSKIATYLDQNGGKVSQISIKLKKTY